MRIVTWTWVIWRFDIDRNFNAWTKERRNEKTHDILLKYCQILESCQSRHQPVPSPFPPGVFHSMSTTRVGSVQAELMHLSKTFVESYCADACCTTVLTFASQLFLTCSTFSKNTQLFLTCLTFASQLFLTCSTFSSMLQSASQCGPDGCGSR